MAGLQFSTDTHVSSNNKSELSDITPILLKMTSNIHIDIDLLSQIAEGVFEKFSKTDIRNNKNFH